MQLRTQDESPMWPSFGGSFDRYFDAAKYPVYPQMTGITEQNALNGQAANLQYRGQTGVWNNNWVPSYHYRGSVSYVTGTHSIKVGFQDAVGYILNANYSALTTPMAFRSKTTITPATPVDANGFF